MEWRKQSKNYSALFEVELKINSVTLVIILNYFIQSGKIVGLKSKT